VTIRETPWPTGTPCWVDLMTSDLSAARLFYEELFGWQIVEAGPDSGGYLMAELAGRPVAGIGPIMGDDPSHPSVWTTYFASADAAATTAQAEAAGARVFTPASDVMGQGVLAVAQDPTGGTFGIWQAKAHLGAERVNEPNTLIWNELMTRDYDAAQAFYATVFGYTYSSIGDASMQYSMIELDGTTVGGLGALAADAPDEVPAHWRVYFSVDDVDDAVNQVVRLGGGVTSPPEDMPYGRHADVTDTSGAALSLITPPAQQ
jgi:predicted enzyme related to lactoylglutathione lyase